MKKHLYLLLIAGGYSLSLTAQHKAAERPLYEARDLTAEHTFSSNIEGPNFDKSGNFYVVNFQKDGTVGKINTRTGAGEIFVTLPDSSVANGVHFNSKGNMFLPDFIRHNVLMIDMHTKKVSVYVHSDQFNQPNDLCINSRDQIYATDPKWANNTGQLWRIDANRKPVLLEANMGTTNGIELSPDEKTCM